MKGGPFAKTLMCFPGIRLVEQTKQKFHRIRYCVKEKNTCDCNSWDFLLYKSGD